MSGRFSAWGAAQQAAKNNGMLVNSDMTQDRTEHIIDILDDAVYGSEEFEQFIEGYYWRDAYAEMLGVVRDQGLAAGPNIDLPEVIPPYWVQEDFYNAITL